jgi:hypothetical protein
MMGAWSIRKHCAFLVIRGIVLNELWGVIDGRAPGLYMEMEAEFGPLEGCAHLDR